MRNIIVAIMLFIGGAAYGQCSPLISLPDTFAIRMDGKVVGLNLFSCNVDTNNVFWVDPGAIWAFPTDFGYLFAAGWLPDTVCIYPERFFQGTVKQIYNLQKAYIAMKYGLISVTDTFTAIDDTTYTLPAGFTLTDVIIKATSAATVKVGTTAGGDDLMKSRACAAGLPWDNEQMVSFSSNHLIYITSNGKAFYKFVKR